MLRSMRTYSRNDFGLPKHSEFVLGRTFPIQGFNVTGGPGTVSWPGKLLEKTHVSCEMCSVNWDNSARYEQLAIV